jgi:hypothetical protein
MVEQRTGKCLNEFSDEELDAQIIEVTSHIFGWM